MKGEWIYLFFVFALYIAFLIYLAKIIKDGKDDTL